MFKPQFVPLVVSGQKRQTIRAVPKRMPKVGDLESWREWTGKPYRSKTRELAQVILTRVDRIDLRENSIQFVGESFGGMEAIAHADGFVSYSEMQHWFELQHGLPFRGILIQSESLYPLHSSPGGSPLGPSRDTNSHP